MKTYADYLAGIFPDFKVQKISVDAGFSCPNRDGAISTGGCIYCRNDSFTPSYCMAGDEIDVQLEKGKKFFSRKYPDMKYLAYFQSYTGTYDKDIKKLESLYKKAVGVKDIVGLVVATRPDCVADEVVNLLAEINKTAPVFIEMGVESVHDDTLTLINRNHTWEDVRNSVLKLTKAGLRCGIHLIMGLPGESKEKMLESVRKICELPIETLKLHQLQVLKDTPLYRMINNGELEVKDFSLEEYLQLCIEIVKIVPENIIIERFLSQSPPHLVVSPSWGLKNYEFMTKLAARIKEQVKE